MPLGRARMQKRKLERQEFYFHQFPDVPREVIVKEDVHCRVQTMWR